MVQMHLYANALPAKETTVAGARMAGQVGDPVSTSVGEYSFDKTLFELGGPLPLEFTLSYASRMHVGKLGTTGDLFGPNWSHNYDLRLMRLGQSEIVVQYGPGDQIKFRDTGGQWQVRPQ